MKQEIHITLWFELAIGKVGLNEIVYELKDLGNPLMLKILEQILMSYDDLIAERLSQTKIYSTKARKGLRRGDPEGRFCRGRKVRKCGYHKEPRKISTVFGHLNLAIRTVECYKCGARYSPLLSALNIGRYARREMNLEHEVIESVIDTNYRSPLSTVIGKRKSAYIIKTGCNTDSQKTCSAYEIRRLNRL